MIELASSSLTKDTEEKNRTCADVRSLDHPYLVLSLTPLEMDQKIKH